MSALTLRCIDGSGRFNPTPDELARLVAFLTEEQEQQASEAAAIDDWLQANGAAGVYGVADLGTRCIVSGGEVMEIDAPTKEGNESNIPF